MKGLAMVELNRNNEYTRTIRTLEYAADYLPDKTMTDVNSLIMEANVAAYEKLPPEEQEQIRIIVATLRGKRKILSFNGALEIIALFGNMMESEK